MTAKAERRRRKRAAQERHPMSAGEREPNGRPSRKVAHADPQSAGPTPELVAQIAAHGPTDMIQRAAKAELITAEQAQALETFASIRRLIGVAEYRPGGPLASMLPQDAGAMTPDEKREWGMRAYREACALMAMAHPDALDACTDACDNRAPRSWFALAMGAKALAGWFVLGRKPV